MKHLCLPRQHLPLLNLIAFFGLGPEAEARIIQPTLGPSSEKVEQIFAPLGPWGPTVEKRFRIHANGCARSGRAPRIELTA
jgi:hypothetical protein